MRGSVEALVLLAVSVFALLAHWRAPIATSFDSRLTLLSALSLVRQGDIDLDEYLQRSAFPAEAKGHQLIQRNGKTFDYFPPGMAMLAAPAMALIVSLKGEEWLLQNLVETERFLAAALIALATTAIYRAARLAGRSVIESLTLTVMFSLATPALSTGSRALWQQSGLIFCYALAVPLLLRVPVAGGLNPLLGLVFGVALVIRPTSAPVVGLLLAAVLVLKGGRTLGTFAAVAGVIVLYIRFNIVQFNQLLPPYFYSSHLAIHPDFLQAIGANLISPSRGLLAWSPFLLLALVAALYTLRGGSASAGLLSAATALACAASLLIHSAFPQWWAGHSLGPRYMSELTPLLFLLFLLSPWRPRRLALAAALTLALPGFYFHWRAANRPGPLLWNGTPENVDLQPQRVWAWRDAQMLRRP